MGSASRLGTSAVPNYTAIVINPTVDSARPRNPLAEGVDGQNVPKYTVNLDLPPEKRWDAITDAYRQYWPELIAQMWRALREDGEGEGEGEGERKGQEVDKSDTEIEFEPNVDSADDELERDEFVSALYTNLCKGLVDEGHEDWVLELQGYKTKG